MKTTTFKYTVTYEVDEWSKAMDLERSIVATLKTFNDENGTNLKLIGDIVDNYKAVDNVVPMGGERSEKKIYKTKTEMDKNGNIIRGAVFGLDNDN
jgi:hypothetical protein